MNLKMIVVLVSDDRTDDVIEAAREAGATGCTTISSARGEGLNPNKTFLGLDLEGQRDMLLFLVADPMARRILETIAAAGKFDEEKGAGIAFQVNIEDAVGLGTQLPTLLEEVEEAL
ncbi:MAG: P-II family nitrogen regulator [Magnetospiraceae bacterium]